MRAETKLRELDLIVFTFLHPWFEKSNFGMKRKRPEKHFTKIKFRDNI